MVERLQGMPEGTLGFRLTGKLTRDEYFEILDPINAQLERGERVSFLVARHPTSSTVSISGRSGRT